MSFPVDLSPKMIEKAKELDINPDDVVEQWVRGGGKGGQKINKTASCVMLNYLPMGILIKCQKHREQSKNRLSAYKLLILKVEDRVKGKESEQNQAIHKLRKQKQKRSKRVNRAPMTNEKDGIY